MPNPHRLMQGDSSSSWHQRTAPSCQTDVRVCQLGTQTSSGSYELVSWPGYRSTRAMDYKTYAGSDSGQLRAWWLRPNNLTSPPSPAPAGSGRRYRLASLTARLLQAASMTSVIAWPYQARTDFLSPAKSYDGSQPRRQHGRMRSSCVEAAARSSPEPGYDTRVSIYFLHPPICWAELP